MLGFDITRKDVSVWDVEVQNWVVPSLTGSYVFWIGTEGAGNLTVACESRVGVCGGGRGPPV